MKKYLIPILLFLCSVFLWLFNYRNLPPNLPVHWDFSGNVNNYDPKLQTFIELHVIMILVFILPIITPKIDPRKSNYKLFQKSYHLMTSGILFIFFLINTSILLNGLGYDINIGSYAFIVIGILFMIIGNYLPNIRSNFFIGVRTPWTLSNEDIWKKTHRASGRLFMLIGFIFLVLHFIPFANKTWIIISLIVLLIGFPYIYSYRTFKNEMNK